MSNADTGAEDADGLALSALWDGEADAADADSALAAYRGDAAARERWHSYALVGAALRGDAAPARTDWVASVMAEVERAQPPVAPAAASAAQAANDPVWHWKLVAGVATVTAIGALAWGVLRSGPDPLAGPAPWAANSAPPSAPVLAADNMLRNPELEALLAEHRQHGGMSAVQLSSGFLRNATYEPPAQR